MKKLFIPLLLLIVVLIPSGRLLATFYSPTELINNALKLDKQEIELQGEAVGEIIERDNGMCWINIFDGSSAIGVYINIEEAKKIGIFGTHKFKGDIVAIKGKLYANDELTGGELDVQGNSLKVVTPGNPIPHLVPLWKIIFAVAGLASSALAYIFWFNYEHRKKKAREFSFELESIINEDIE
jgi:hypothetical protein